MVFNNLILVCANAAYPIKPGKGLIIITGEKSSWKPAIFHPEPNAEGVQYIYWNRFFANTYANLKLVPPIPIDSCG